MNVNDAKFQKDCISYKLVLELPKRQHRSVTELLYKSTNFPLVIDWLDYLNLNL